jgi:hypothetical protein
MHVTVFRDGIPIDDCQNPATVKAEPDPCIASRLPRGGAGVDVRIYTSHASTWNFGTAVGGTSVGQCAGSIALGTVAPSLADATQVGVTLKTKLLKDLGTKTALAGDCSAIVRPGDSIHPAGGLISPLTPKAMAASLVGNASCADASDDPNAAAGWPLNGKITWTMSQLNELGKPYQIQADVSVSGTSSAGADVVDVGGIVLKGAAIGARVGGTLWEDPVVRSTGASGYNTGYGLDLANATACGDSTAGNASISTVMIGGGGSTATSLMGNNAEGITFTLGE